MTAVVLAAMAPGPLPRLLNVAGGGATPVRAIADGLIVASGFQGRLEESGPGSHRSASVSWQRADVSAAVAALGWRPRLTLAQSLADLWNEGAAAPADPIPPGVPATVPAGAPGVPDGVPVGVPAAP